MTLDNSPALVSTMIAVVCSLLSAIMLPSGMLVGIGLVGSLVTSAGSLRGIRRYVGYGTLLLLTGILIGGAQGASVESLVVSTLLAVLAWDAGRYGITIGEQLGRTAKTVHIELAHSALNGTIGVAGTGLGYVMYRLVANGQPVAAVGLLLGGAGILILSLR